MSKPYEDSLIEAGLLPSEVKTYITCLRFGGSTVQDIAKKAKISRTAAYDAIRALQEYRLMYVRKSGKKNIYLAEEPDRILSFIREKRFILDNTMEDMQRMLPQLQALSTQNPEVQAISGLDGLRAFYDHFEKHKPEFSYEITNIDDISQYFSKKDFLKAKNTTVFTKTKTKRLYAGAQSALDKIRKNLEIRKLPSSRELFHGNITIYQNTTIFITYEESQKRVTVTFIENGMVAESMKTLFHILWDQSR